MKNEPISSDSAVNAVISSLKRVPSDFKMDPPFLGNHTDLMNPDGKTPDDWALGVSRDA
jgi:hypothetical protein